MREMYKWKKNAHNICFPFYQWIGSFFIFVIFVTLGKFLHNQISFFLFLCVESFQEKKNCQFELLYLDNLVGEKDNIA